MATQTSRKRVSIRTRMVIIFGAVIIVGFTVLTALVMRQTRASVMETVQNQLIDKARDTASIMDSEVRQWYEYLDGFALQQILQDPSVSYLEKARFIERIADNEKKSDESIISFAFIDPKGIYHMPDGKDFDVSSQKWLRSPKVA